MTLLSTSQEILRETKSASIPTSIIGNLEDSAVQILQAMTLAVTNVSRGYEWQELQEEHTFSSVASTEDYSLPTDWDSFVNNTFWNTTTNLKVIGPENPQDWTILKYSTASNASTDDYFRIRGKKVLLFPKPTGVENFLFEYLTNLIVKDSGGTGQTGWLADTDVPVLDEFIIKLDATWRFRKMQGLNYAEEQRDADLAIAERASKNGAKKTIHHINRDRLTMDTSRIGYPTTVTAP